LEAFAVSHGDNTQLARAQLALTSRLEIPAPGRRTLSGRVRHGPADARVDAVNHMQDQRERGHQRALLRQVRQQHRMVVLGPPLLEVGPPAIEALLPRGFEAQERHLLGGQLLGPYPGGLQPVEALEHRNRPRPRVAASGHTDPEGPAFETRGALKAGFGKV
jgi:hypothetical protein